MQLALDKSTNDLVISDTGVARVSEGRFVVQQVSSKLRTLTSEWVLNPLVGWLDTNTFVKNPDLFGIEIRAREIILGTQGVLSIESLTLVLEGRSLAVTFSATTKYGVIDNTIHPWKD
jgi:hypothetical protein